MVQHALFRTHRTLLFCCVCICFLLLLPLVAHHYISKQYDVQHDLANSDAISIEGGSGDYGFQSDPLRELHRALQVQGLNSRIREMVRIRSSVASELRTLEGQRQKLRQELSTLTTKVDELKALCNRKQADLERIRLSLDQIQYDQREANLHNQPFIARPLQILPSEVPQLSKHHNKKLTSDFNWQSCSMRRCFDYSRCSVTSGFRVYFYHPTQNTDDDDEQSNIGREQAVQEMSTASQVTTVLDAFSSNRHITFDAATACVFAVLLLPHHFRHNNSRELEHYIRTLPFYNEGLNHVVFNFIPDTDLLATGINLGKAMVVQSHFSERTYRRNFDITFNVVPPADTDSAPIAHCPARRKYLATYNGPGNGLVTVMNALTDLESKATSDVFKFVFEDSDNEDSVLSQSTYALVLPEVDSAIVSSAKIHTRMRNVLKNGAIPVVLGGEYLKLPFDEVLDWSRAAVLLPTARVTELHYILKSIGDGDLLELKRQGTLYFKRYLSSVRSSVDTALAVIRQTRLQIAAPAARDEPSILMYNASQPMKYFDPTENVSPDSAEPDEMLGPLEPPFPSLTYQRNHSLTLTHGYQLWNEVSLDPFTTYPFTPFDPVLPSEAKFIGSSYGFRPIGSGSGGAGKEFSERLGGNVPKEQFTIVVLTYEREAVLIDSLQRLKGLPYLNKVLVSPSAALQ